MLVWGGASLGWFCLGWCWSGVVLVWVGAGLGVVLVWGGAGLG